MASHQRLSSKGRDFTNTPSPHSFEGDLVESLFGIIFEVQEYAALGFRVPIRVPITMLIC